jgi:hypothetical protein
VSPGVRTLCRVLALSATCLSIPGPAHAEWQFTPFVGYTFGASTTFFDFDLSEEGRATDETRINFGGSVRWIGASPLGLEVYYVHTPGFFDAKQFDLNLARVTGSRTHAIMGNVVVATPRSWNRYGLRPSLSGGIGLMHASADDGRQIITYNENLLGMNLGGGAVGMLSDRVGVRFDLRYFRNIKGVSAEDLDFPVTGGEPVRLRYWTLGFGVVIKP